jgi:arylsulfatase A
LRGTDYYACSGICAPSRAGLLTGRYPFRSGMTGNPYPVDEPRGQTVVRNFGNQMSAFGSMDQHERYTTEGISDREFTLAQGFQAAGYRTAMIGKWHLGDFGAQPQFNPRRFGFQRFFGVPHSNDMTPCPLYRDEQRELADIQGILPTLTGRYTAEALDVIASARGQPFFLYLAHTFPHQPLAASPEFAGRSMAGRYGDAVEELDWSVGQIVAALDRAGVADDTLLIFTSDNGPWFEGSAGALRGGKGQGYDGAFKVPFLARWPGVIQPGRVCAELMTNLDLFPTLLGLAGVAMPTDRIIDGLDLRRLLDGTAAKSPREIFYYYHYDELQAVRMRHWKYIRRTNRYVWPVPLDAEALPRRLGIKALGPDRAPLLYDLVRDPGERYNLLAHEPELAARLDELMTAWQARNAGNPRGFRIAAG